MQSQRPLYYLICTRDKLQSSSHSSIFILPTYIDIRRLLAKFFSIITLLGIGINYLCKLAVVHFEYDYACAFSPSAPHPISHQASIPLRSLQYQPISSSRRFVLGHRPFVQYSPSRSIHLISYDLPDVPSSR